MWSRSASATRKRLVELIDLPLQFCHPRRQKETCVVHVSAGMRNAFSRSSDPRHILQVQGLGLRVEGAKCQPRFSKPAHERYHDILHTMPWRCSVYAKHVGREGAISGVMVEGRGRCFALTQNAFLRRRGVRGARGYMKRELNQNLSSNEVYYTAYFLLVILKNSCINLHCLEGFNCILFSYQTSSVAASSLGFPDVGGVTTREATSNSGFRVSGFGFQVSGFGFRVQGAACMQNTCLRPRVRKKNLGTRGVAGGAHGRADLV